MAEKRSIQDIIPPARSRPIRPTAGSSNEPQKTAPSNQPPKTPKPPRSPKIRRGGGNNMFGLIGIALAVVVIVGVAFGVVSTMFHRADVSITLKKFTVSIAETFEASPDGVLLSFAERTISETRTKEVPRSGSEFVEERASGKIVIFNEHSTSNQRLITNTRFEAPNGNIYRVKSPVVVPGYIQSGSSIVPGEIEVTVYADEPGESYNIGIVDFTIPGLKGTSQFDNMYARASGPIEGGFVGEKAVVSPEVKDAAVAELKSELDREIRDSIERSLGDDEMFFPETVEIFYIEEPDRTSNDGAVVAVTAEAIVPVFTESKLARVIAQEGGVSYENALTIENVDSLAINTATSETEGNLSLTISGEAQLVGAYDQERLIQDLAGKDRRNVGVVLSGYPAISDMKISVYPFWRGILPEDPARFTLEIVEESEAQ